MVSTPVRGSAGRSRGAVDRRLAAAVARAGQLGQVQRGYVGDLGSQSDFAHDDSPGGPLGLAAGAAVGGWRILLIVSARRRCWRPRAAALHERAPTPQRGCDGCPWIYVLDLGEYLEAVFPAFASGARGLHPAERLAQVAHVLAVDEDHPGLDAACQAMGLADVLGPDGEARPYSTSLARRSASASSLNGIRQTTGPKISSWAMRMRLSTSANTVGWMNCPCSGAPAGPDAPGRRPPGWRLPRGRCGCSR